MPKALTADALKGKSKVPVTRTMPLRRRPVERLHTRFPSQDSHSSYLDQLDNIPLSSVREEPFDKSDTLDGSRPRMRDRELFVELGIAAPVPSKRFKHLSYALSKHSTLLNPTTLLEEGSLTFESPSHTSSPPATPFRHASTSTQPSVSPQPTPSIPATRPTGRPASRPVSSGEHRKTQEYIYPRESLKTPLIQDEPIDEHLKLSEKDMEKEYWRRQRRVFVRSRFITMDEAAYVANCIYRHQHVESHHRMVVTFQANIANFRSKWRKILKEVAPTLGITKDDLTDLVLCEARIFDMLDESMLEWIWGHWIVDPFVDRQAFYNNQDSLHTLTKVTAKALLVTLRHVYNMMKQRDFRKQLDDLDQYTRTIYLPDPKP